MVWCVCGVCVFARALRGRGGRSRQIKTSNTDMPLIKETQRSHLRLFIGFILFATGPTPVSWPTPFLSSLKENSMSRNNEAQMEVISRLKSMAN